MATKSSWITLATAGTNSMRKTPRALLKAEQRFNELMKGGYTAAVRSPTGDPTIVRKFDPAAKETLFYPRLVGG